MRSPAPDPGQILAREIVAMQRPEWRESPPTFFVGFPRLLPWGIFGMNAVRQAVQYDFQTQTGRQVQNDG